MFAPIVLFTFKRLDLLKRLLSSLEDNDETSETDLYIYSDLNVKEDDAGKVRAVRSFIVEYSKDNPKFRSINVICADVHKGLAASVIEGVTDVVERYGRVIVLEDDLVVSKYFLRYMNRSLDCYENDDRIWSVSGYSAYVKAKERYDKPVYLDYRATSWGWGTWKDRWESVDWNVPEYEKFKWDISANLRFCRGGNDLPSMLRAQMKGKIDSWAVRWCYYQSKYNKYAIAPTVSVVANEGFGNDATNCNEEGYEKFGRKMLDEEVKDWYVENLSVNEDICRDLYKLYSISLAIRVRDKIREWFPK